MSMKQSSSPASQTPNAEINDLLKDNPLLSDSELPLFSKVKPGHLKPAVEYVIGRCKELVIGFSEKYKEDPTYDNVLQPLEEADDKFSRVWSVASHLNSVNNTQELREAYDACLPLVSDYSSFVGQYRPLFEVYKKIHESAEFEKLNPAKQKAVNNALRDFKLTGIDLPEEQQKRYAEISSRLSQLETAFANNVLDATHSYVLEIKDEADLKGLPQAVCALARSEAQNRGKDGWVFTLDMPFYLPFLTYADNRDLREQIYTAYNTRASELGPDAGKWDNAPLMEEILKLRHEQAKLLGFESYAHLSLATKTAASPKEVMDFLTDLARKSKPQGLREVGELKEFAKSLGLSELKPWDVAYCSEKLRQQKFSYNAEELRPYFPVDTVIKGLFECARRLYKVSFEPREGIDVWNENVRVFDILKDSSSEDGTGRHKIGTFFMDLYAREGKRGGAWMDECASRRIKADGTLQLPAAYLVCNFSRPVGNKQSQLTHDEVVTVFHEFGHSLNQLLTKVDVADVSGINGVPWDVVELPSQFNENFAWQDEVLKFLSGHAVTHEPLPAEKLKALIKARNFESAMAMLRQLEFAIFDFRIHLEYDEQKGGRVLEILEQVRDQVTVAPRFDKSRFANNFTHIFAGGYAAGYYSYKWAEVLAADAFGKFLEDGIFNESTGKAFEQHVMSIGGALDSMQEYEVFRGRKPTVDALLEQNGIEF